MSRYFSNNELNTRPKSLLEKILDHSKTVLYYSAITLLPLYSPASIQNDIKEPNIVSVSRVELPSNVLGLYNTVTENIYLPNYLVGENRDDVLAHEVAHHEGNRNEYNTNIVAADRTGRNLDVIGSQRII
jgi:hypothetical protein